MTVDEPSPIPGPPGNFSATTSGNTVSFTWTGSSVGAAANHLPDRSRKRAGPGQLALLDTGAVATSLIVPNVPPGTYWVRVRGANDAGTGGPSQDVSVVMGPAGGCVGLPAAPVLLTPVVVGCQRVAVWNAPTIRSRADGLCPVCGLGVGAVQSRELWHRKRGHLVRGVRTGRRVLVRLAASNACGVGPVSNEVTFTLGINLPGSPENLASSVATGGLVTLTWDAPASGGAVTSYLVEAGSSPGLADLATLSTGSAGTVFHASAPAGTYYVRVRGVNGAGASSASGEIVVVVP